MKDGHYRAILDSFWTDIMIVELEPDEKLMYLWLITNQHLDICGCYQVSHRTIEYETGIPWQRGRDIFRKLEELERISYSEQNREILLLKWKSNNEGFFKPENTKSVKSIRTGVERIKTPDFKNIILQWLGDEQAPTEAPTLPPSLEGNAQPNQTKPEPNLKVKSMEHVEISGAGPAEKTAAGEQAVNLPVVIPLVERQIRQAIDEKRLLIKEKYPDADIEVETEEIIAKYRGQSLGVDPWVMISRWFKNLKKPQARGRESPVSLEQQAAEIREHNRQVCREFANA